MARPLGFDRDRVIVAATRTFWRHGLHATTAEDLCQSTGLGRSSLYNSFGSKNALFEECLDSYLAQARARVDALLGDADRPVLERIGLLLKAIAAEEVDRAATDAPRGCLAVNTVAELADGPESVEALRRIGEDTATRIHLLGSALRAGQASGEITREVRAEGLAAFVNAAIVGLRLASQGEAAPDRLDDIVASTMRALRP